MNFNVYVDKATAERLGRLAKTRKTSRNMLVRQALESFIDKEAEASWPRAVMDHQGVGLEPFEKSRAHLKTPARDPLA